MTAAGSHRLTAYRLHAGAAPIRPAVPARDWMDATRERYAYRCLPLSIANASGWEIVCPEAFEAVWFGGDRKEDLVVKGGGQFAVSHFGGGTLTFHTGYLFRTEPGWALWVRGRPNAEKPRIAPLEGLVETDWLTFPFTMNWRFTRTGVVRFEKGEPIAFVTPVAHAALDAYEIEVRSIDSDPDLKATYEARSAERMGFNAALAARDPDATKRGWEKHYVRGCPAASHHVTKRRMKAPREVA